MHELHRLPTTITWMLTLGYRVYHAYRPHTPYPLCYDLTQRRVQLGHRANGRPDVRLPDYDQGIHCQDCCQRTTTAPPTTATFSSALASFCSHARRL